MIIKNILSGDINTICIIMLFFGAIIIAFVKHLKKLLMQDKKKTILYLLVTILAFAFLAIFSIENFISKTIMPNFITLQVFALIFGIGHVAAMNKFLKWEDNTKYLAQFLFSLIVCIVGSIVFVQISGRWGVSNMQYFFLAGTIPFIFPWVFLALFETAMSIPLAIYNTWKYPESVNYIQPNPNELVNLRVISLEIIKSKRNKTTSKFKAKAPEQMHFGNFFYHFINDYNQQYPNSAIDTLNSENKTFKWIFYRKPKFIGRWKLINADHTVAKNSIKDNHTILCERVLN